MIGLGDPLMPQLASPPQLPSLKPLERLGIGVSLFVGAGKPAASSTWTMLCGLALLPVLIWLVVLLFVGLGLALELIHWDDLPMAQG
jgi:hypothetical protein